MVDRRKANVSWWVTNETGHIIDIKHAQLAVLMDIRDNLESIKHVLNCRNFQGIPNVLRKIRENTCKVKRARAREV